MTTLSLQDRMMGSLVGGAIGDAIGGPHENGSCAHEVVVPKIFEFSDDTQLTLATCEAMLESGVAPEAVARSFVRWFRNGKITGLGASTLKALRDLASGQHWALSGRKGDRAAGNGAAMRIAPVAFALDPKSQQGRRSIRDICRITHDNDEAYAGALAVALWIDASAKCSIEPCALAAKLPDSRVRDQILDIEASSAASLAEIAQEFGNSGYVAESIPFAIAAARCADSRPFDDVLVELVEAGGDTDTNGSLFGQMAGARHGIGFIPSRWAAQIPTKVTDAIEAWSSAILATT